MQWPVGTFNLPITIGLIQWRRRSSKLIRNGYTLPMMNSEYSITDASAPVFLTTNKVCSLLTLATGDNK